MKISSKSLPASFFMDVTSLRNRRSVLVPNGGTDRKLQLKNELLRDVNIFKAFLPMVDRCNGVVLQGLEYSYHVREKRLKYSELKLMKKVRN